MCVLSYNGNFCQLVRNKLKKKFQDNQSTLTIFVLLVCKKHPPPETSNYVTINQGDNALFLPITLMPTKEEIIC